MRIYIVRHGETDKNKEKRLQGRSNSPLNENGRKQAEEAGAYFYAEHISFDRVYTSPLSRAVETAELITGNDACIRDDRLLEMDYGPYEGISLENLPEEIRFFFSDFVHNPAPEGMESLPHVVERLGKFLREIAEESEDCVLLSCHAISMKGALEYLTPESNGSYWSKYIGNCAVYMTEYKDGRFTVPYEIQIRH